MSFLTTMKLRQLFNYTHVQNSTFRCCSVAPKRKKKNDLTTTVDPPSTHETEASLLNFLNSSIDLKKVESKVPPNLIKIHKTTPDYLYLVSDTTAKTIVNLIGSKLKGDIPVIEVNPGFGCLTKKLLDFGISYIKTFEASPHYEPFLKDLKDQYPDKLNNITADFFNMWKSAYIDKMDGGNRMEVFFEGLEKKEFGSDISIKLIGSMSSNKFMRHLLLSIVFQESLISYGRPDLYVTMSPSQYFMLSGRDDSNEVNYLHRPIPVLFNILFDYQLMGKIPRKHFLPWQNLVSKKLKKNMANFTTKDRKHLYLVNITVKAKLPCSSANLPLLWFFFKQHLMNKTNRIIPMLEKWIPGCGVWLITNQDPPGSNPDTLPDENDAPLPHINIFTRFSDLTPNEKLTVFKKFISWPEYEYCPFRESFENYILKMVPTDDLKDDALDIEDESNEPIQ